MPRRPSLLGLVVIALVALPGGWHGAPGSSVSADALPRKIADRAFWQMVTSFSEPGGYFRSDNLVSNESTFQRVVPELRARTPRGGVYLGVGPDQNFTYISVMQPKIAFIIDIRRQNMLLHLMYKAVIELSPTRAEFLSRLFSRKQPSGLSSDQTPEQLFEAYQRESPSEKLFLGNLNTITERLTHHHGFSLTESDLRALTAVYKAFYRNGPELRYSLSGQFGGGWFPTYAELTMEADDRGEQHSYLANEERYKVLRDLERANLIVPLVGDFGGDKAIRSVATYLQQHGATVTAFYTSNVEQYLFQNDSWSKFIENVATLPADEHSTFIRAYFNFGFRVVRANPYERTATLLDSIADLVRAFQHGEIHNYSDVIERSR